MQAGIPRNPDFNGATQDGVGYYQMTVGKGRRWSAAVAYLRPARNRKNLVVVPNAHATRVLIEDKRAVGVEYRTPTRARAGAGAWRGYRVGRRLRLAAAPAAVGHRARRAPEGYGRRRLHDLPAVGANLHDHFNSYVAWRATRTGTLNDLALSPTRKVMAGIEYVLSRRGPLSQISTLAGILVRSDPRFDRPDLQMNIFLWSIEKRDATGIYPHKWPGFSISPVHLRPEGRGRVSLKSPDPLSPPKIEFKFLETAHDIDAMLYGLRLARKIASQPALKPFIAEEVQPGAAVTSDEALIEDTRKRGVSNLHPVGTCRMGIGSDAVVDARLGCMASAGSGSRTPRSCRRWSAATPTRPRS